MEISVLEKRLQEIKHKVQNEEHLPENFFKDTYDEYVCSAQNLLRYLKLRTIDIREIQTELTVLGISSLGTSAGYVLENISRSIALVRLIQGLPVDNEIQKSKLGFRESTMLLEARSTSLFNGANGKTNTQIMVTMPDEAAENTELLRNLFSAGMDIARINLSHGEPELWNNMLQNIHQVVRQLEHKSCVFMDLPGPKIRVDAVYAFSPQENRYENVNSIAVHIDFQFDVMKDDEFSRRRHMDTLLNHVVTVLLPEIIDGINVGDRIFFDDGAIEGTVTSKSKGSARVKISTATKKRLRVGKGINLPDTHLSLPSLTQNDLELLPYASKNADIIGYSFVRTPEDVATLYTKLAELGDTRTGVVFKIENKEAFENLPRILFEAMKRPRIGVMIARGDLAVEIGFDRISEVKNQIMAICEAAHIPVIWATQVLETMAKKGLATRAEISDVVLSVHAECVMLNKGPHITQTVAMLKNILTRMEEHSAKNKKILRPLEVARKSLEDMI